MNPAMDRSDSLMRISDTAELDHLLEQKMRKNSKKISYPEVRRRPNARPLISTRLTTKIPPTTALNAKIPKQFPIAENKRIQKYKAEFAA